MTCSTLKSPDTQSSSANPPIKVAIIGSGLSGLVSAYLLSSKLKSSSSSLGQHDAKQREIEVHIFERASKLGMDSKSISIRTDQDDLTPPLDSSNSLHLSGGISSWFSGRRRTGDQVQLEKKIKPGMERKKGERRIDVPMRSFNIGYYTQTLALYKRLGIPIRKTNFTYSFATSNLSKRRSPRSPAQSASPLSSSRGSPPTSLPSAGAESPPRGSKFEESGLFKSDFNHPRRDSRAPSPSILYNGASGARGFSLPSSMKPDLPFSDFTSVSPFALLGFMVATLPTYLMTLITYTSNLAIITLSYLYLTILAVHHHFLGHTLDPHHPISLQSISDFCSSHRIPKLFVDGLLISLFSAVMTAQAESVKEAPAAEILDYIAATFGQDHCTVETGVEKVEKALTENLKRKDRNHGIHTDCKVVDILPGKIQGQVSLRVVKEDARINDDDDDGEAFQERQFDGFSHVIFATQANQSSRFLESYIKALKQPEPIGIDREEEIQRLELVSKKLQSFKYETSVVTNHTDRSLLPLDEKDWRDLNLISPALDDARVWGSRINNSSQLNFKRPLSRLNMNSLSSRGRDDSSSSISSTDPGPVASSAPSSSEEEISPRNSSLGRSYSSGITTDTEDEGSTSLKEKNSNTSSQGKSLLVGQGQGKGMNERDLREMTTKLDFLSNPLKDGNHTMATHIIQRRLHPAPANVTPGEVRVGSVSNQSDSLRRSSTCRLVEAYDGPLLMQTTNALPGLGPRPEYVLSVSTFERVVLSKEGKISQSGLFDFVRREKKRNRNLTEKALDLLVRSRSQDWEMKLGSLQGKGKGKGKGSNENENENVNENARDRDRDRPGIWFSGSWSPGIPLLEGCVRTARLVCEELIRLEGLEFESPPW